MAWGRLAIEKGGTQKAVRQSRGFRTLAGSGCSNRNICRSVEDRHPESEHREPRDLFRERTSKKAEEKAESGADSNRNIQELESTPTHRKQTAALSSNRTNPEIEFPKSERKVNSPRLPNPNSKA
jgi:hypothetical protein